MLGFVIFDMVYLSIVVNYSFQCQLLIYYVQSIKDRVLTHDWPGIGLEQSGPAYSIDSILEKAMKVSGRVGGRRGPCFVDSWSSQYVYVYAKRDIPKTCYTILRLF